MEILDRLRDCIVSFDAEGVKRAAYDAIEAGIPAYRAIAEGMARGIDIVSQKYEAGEYFLPELVMSGETMNEGLKILKPLLTAEKRAFAGRVVIGTVAGDIHNIGKNIVISMLQSSGFEVHDLGVDVPERIFVSKIRELKPDIVALSALLITTMPRMKTTIDALKKAGLRKKVKIMVGGRPLTEAYAKEIGADGYGKDAMSAVKLAKRLLKNKLQARL